MLILKLIQVFNFRLRRIIRNKIDIKGGKFTLAQHNELWKIFTSGADEMVMFKKIFHALHHYNVRYVDYILLKSYLNEILEGVEFWLKAEEALRYEPTSEENEAGILELSKNLGEFATIKTLAKNYFTDVDDVLAWEYGKVFMILYADFEEFKFQKRYNEIIERKYRK